MLAILSLAVFIILIVLILGPGSLSDSARGYRNQKTDHRRADSTAHFMDASRAGVLPARATFDERNLNMPGILLGLLTTQDRGDSTARRPSVARPCRFNRSRQPMPATGFALRSALAGRGGCAVNRTLARIRTADTATLKKLRRVVLLAGQSSGTAAARALARSGKRGRRILVALLAHPRPRVRVAALRAISGVTIKNRPALLQRAIGDESALVRGAAYHAVARMQASEGYDGASLLFRNFEMESRSVQSAILRATFHLSSPSDSMVRRLVAHYWNAPAGSSRRLEVIAALGNTKLLNGAGIHLLLDRAVRADGREALAAVQALYHQQRSARVFSALRGRLADKSCEVRRAAAWGLVRYDRGRALVRARTDDRCTAGAAAA